MAKTRLPLRYAWDHRGSLHRRVVRTANATLVRVPPSIKYGLVSRLTSRRVPYSLVGGATIVQIGAPYDTLGAGRSRAAHLGYAVGDGGHLVVIEPLKESVEAFRAFAKEYLPCRTTVIHAAAWSSAGEVELQVDRSHPATNFSSPEVVYNEKDLTRFESVTVRSDTVDQLLSEIESDLPFLVSVTTNWAETEILLGMTDLLGKGLRYCSLALGPEDELYEHTMTGLGFEHIGFDDRGATYRRVGAD